MEQNYLAKMLTKEIVSMLKDHAQAIEPAEKYTGMLLKEAADRLLILSAIVEKNKTTGI